MAERAAPPVLQQAIAWSVRLNSGRADEALREACRRWREADAEHDRVWRQVQAIEDDLRAVATPAAAGALRAPAAMGRRRALAALGLGAATAGIAMAAYGDNWRRWSADYRTAVGERRRYALDGGAQLWLNTGSAVQADGQRRLTLVAGELCLDTGAAGGAWEVRSREACFTARQARFVLRQLDGATTLDVQRGSVRVEPWRGPAADMQAGTRCRVGAGGELHALPAAAYDAAGWSDGMLKARGMRLGDFLAELARYQHGWVQCDPAVADLRVSGVFLLDDVPGALDTLAHALPVAVRRYTRLWTRVVPA